MPETKNHRGRQSGERRKARFLIIIQMMVIVLILVIASFYILLTIFKFYSISYTYTDSFGPPNNPRSWVLLLLPFHR